MNTWQMQDAKAHLSQVIKQAQTETPQSITLHGKPVAVVLSQASYARLSQNKLSLVDFIQQSPLYGEDFPLQREQSLTRDILL